MPSEADAVACGPLLERQDVPALAKPFYSLLVARAFRLPLPGSLLCFLAFQPGRADARSLQLSPLPDGAPVS